MSTVATKTKNTLINAPVPLIVIETDGNIVWKSKKFVTQFKGIEINPYLDSIVKEIKLEIENSQEEIEIKKQITIENRIYNIIGNYTRSKKRDKRKQKEYILTLYFIDETEYNELLAKYNDSVEKVEEKLKRKIDRSRWNQGHHDFIFFGRYLCHSRNPECERCPFKSFCKKDKYEK